MKELLSAGVLMNHLTPLTRIPPSAIASWSILRNFGANADDFRLVRTPLCPQAIEIGTLLRAFLETEARDFLCS